jgi:hypothetical protein
MRRRRKNHVRLLFVHKSFSDEKNIKKYSAADDQQSDSRSDRYYVRYYIYYIILLYALLYWQTQKRPQLYAYLAMGFAFRNDWTGEKEKKLSSNVRYR